MPSLIAFILKHFANGFLLGAAVALAAMITQPTSMAVSLAAESPVGLLLVVFALGSSFGIGSLATALWLAVDD